MINRAADPDVVELLYRLVTDRPLRRLDVERVLRATAADWDALTLLLNVDGAMLDVEAVDCCERLRAAGAHDVADKLDAARRGDSQQ